MNAQHTSITPQWVVNPAWDSNSGIEGASGSGVLEKSCVVVLALAGIVAVLLYRAGYGYVGMLIVGAPFLLACLVEPRVSIYAYFFWQAWDSAIVLGDTRQGGWLTAGKLLAFCVVAVTLLHIWRRPLKVTSSRGALLWAFAFCAVALASAMWSYDIAKSLRLALQILVQVILAVIIMTAISGELGPLKRLAFWAVLGGATAGAYVLFFGMDQRAFGRATLSEQANPVSAAGGLVVALGFVPLLWTLTRSRLFKLLLVVAVGFMLFGIVGTGTRAAIGGILGGVAISAVLTGGGQRVKRVLGMLAALGCMYVIGAAAIYSSLVPGQAATRLAEFMMLPAPEGHSQWAGKTAGTRTYVWELALNGYSRSGIMGAGVGASALASFEAGGSFKDVHSNILGALVEMGPIGLITFLGLHVALGLGLLRLRQPSLQMPGWVVLLSSFAMGIAHTTYTTKMFWLPVTVVLILIEFDARATTNETNLWHRSGWLPSFPSGGGLPARGST